MASLPKLKHTAVTIAVLTVILLTGCGGGGSAPDTKLSEASQTSSPESNGETALNGGVSSDGEAPSNSETTSTAEVTPIATESSPVGPQVDLAGAGYMVFVDGSNWSYSMFDANGSEMGILNRSLSQLSSDGSSETLKFTYQIDASTQTSAYVKKPDGLYYDFTKIISIPPGAAQQIGLIRELAFPAYAVGENRVIVREGVWDKDLDGDGSYEQFRLEYIQVYNGLVPLALPWDSAASVAKFSSSYRLAVTTSKAPQQTLGWFHPQEEYFAKNIGWVKKVERRTDLAGNIIDPSITFVIKSATVNGISYAGPTQTEPKPDDPAAGNSVVKVDLPHHDLVYDAIRNLYYASVPSTVIGNGNSIAIIDPLTGGVTYSSPVGSDPNVLSLSPDGKYLYVGLEGAGQVVKLSLPSLAEVARIALGSEPFYGTYFADSITVSPANSSVIAVALKNKGISPRHAGVVLVNGTAIAPKKTQRHTGSNLVAFNSDGTVLYGFNNESTEYGLRQIAAAPDGLTEVKLVAAQEAYGIRSFQYRNGKLYLGAQLYSAHDLALIGQFKPTSTTCRPLQSATKVACLPSLNDSQQMTVYDASTLVAQSVVPFAFDRIYVKNFVPGPSGNIAISYGQDYSSSSTLYLLNDQNF